MSRRTCISVGKRSAESLGKVCMAFGFVPMPRLPGAEDVHSQPVDVPALPLRERQLGGLPASPFAIGLFTGRARASEVEDNLTTLMQQANLEGKRIAVAPGGYRDLNARTGQIEEPAIQRHFFNCRKFGPPEPTVQDVPQFTREMSDALQATPWFAKTKIGQYFWDWLAHGEHKIANRLPLPLLKDKYDHPLHIRTYYNSPYQAVLDGLQLNMEPEVLEIYFNAYLEDSSVRDLFHKHLAGGIGKVPGLQCKSYLRTSVRLTPLGLPIPDISQLIKFTKFFTHRHLYVLWPEDSKEWRMNGSDDRWEVLSSAGVLLMWMRKPGAPVALVYANGFPQSTKGHELYTSKKLRSFYRTVWQYSVFKDCAHDFRKHWK